MVTEFPIDLESVAVVVAVVPGVAMCLYVSERDVGLTLDAGNVVCRDASVISAEGARGYLNNPPLEPFLSLSAAVSHRSARFVLDQTTHEMRNKKRG